MPKVKGKNVITLNGATLCDIVQDWLNAGGPFTKNPVKVTDVKSETYNETFAFSFEQGDTAPETKEVQ